MERVKNSVLVNFSLANVSRWRMKSFPWKCKSRFFECIKTRLSILYSQKWPLPFWRDVSCVVIPLLWTVWLLPPTEATFLRYGDASTANSIYSGCLWMFDPAQISFLQANRKTVIWPSATRSFWLRSCYSAQDSIFSQTTIHHVHSRSNTFTIGNLMSFIYHVSHKAW